MTVVDPDRLAREVEHLQSLVPDPESVRREVLNLFEFYASRTRRRAATSEEEGGPRVLGVPRPVQRSVRRGVSSALSGDADHIVPVAQALWRAGYVETQKLAAALLGELSGPGTVTIVHRLAAEDPEGARTALAADALRSWRRAHPDEFLDQTSRWIRSTAAWERALGLRALDAAVKDSQFDRLPAVFRMLHGQVDSARGVVRRELFALVRALAAISPKEAANFLLEELERAAPNVERMARHALEDFPPDQKAALKRALSG